MTRTINALAEQQANIHHLLVHSISQNNVLGSFSASVTHNIEKHIEAIEESTKATEIINKTNFSTILELGEQFQQIGDSMTGVEGPDRLEPSPIQAKLDSLGTRAQIPTGYMVKTLRSQSTCDSNMPSDQMLSTF